MKRITDISKIYNGHSLLIKDFTDLDLSDLDLSKIPKEAWEGCVFHNTNFSNTGIVFRPNVLHFLYSEYYKHEAYSSIEGCDFSGCDLSYLTELDFEYVKFKGCNFDKTNLHVDLKTLPRFEPLDWSNKSFDARDVKFDESYSECNEEYWEKFYFNARTIELNPKIKISSAAFSHAIVASLPKDNKILSLDEIKYWVEYCEHLLTLDKSGDLAELYKIISPLTDLYGRYSFFCQKIKDINFKNITFKSFSAKLLSCFAFENCVFEDVTFETEMEDLTSLDYRVFHSNNNFKNIFLPSATPSSWRRVKSTKVPGTPITFRTNVYVELSRVCNAKCSFCRNNSFTHTKYSLSEIEKSLESLYPYLNDLVIGGGEPYLHLEDIRKLKRHFLKSRTSPNWYIFTNGSFSANEIIYFSKYNSDQGSGFNFNISRHAVDDKENAAIFGLPSSKIITTKDLESVAKNTHGVTTICATCFDGGLDSFEKIIEYLKFVQSLGFKKVLLSSLHLDGSLGSKKTMTNEGYINDEIFDQIKEYLQFCGFQKKIAIYSTGGYISTVLTRGSFSIAFKEYISKRQLEEEWPMAIKKSFDLSIDPAGQIFENWHQTSDCVKRLELVRKDEE